MILPRETRSGSKWCLERRYCLRLPPSPVPQLGRTRFHRCLRLPPALAEATVPFPQVTRYYFRLPPSAVQRLGRTRLHRVVGRPRPRRFLGTSGMVRRKREREKSSALYAFAARGPNQIRSVRGCWFQIMDGLESMSTVLDQSARLFRVRNINR